jgi:alkaline phosphatase
MKTDRRNFILGAMAVPLAGTGLAADEGTVRFGVVTDCHYAQRPLASWTGSSRHYPHSTAKLRDAVEVFGRSRLDFAIELGDFKDMGPTTEKSASGGMASRPAKALRDEALGFLDEIEGEFRRFKAPRYHVLGNHDMDCISKEEFLSRTENHGAAKGKTRYSFSVRGVKFVVLDGCFNPDGSPYRRGNFDWRKAVLPKDELEWFDAELESASGPTVVFCHQLLDGFSRISPAICLSNWRDAVAIMERRGNVLASIQGHHHSGHHSFRKGIHYWTMKAMIEGPHPSRNSYAVVEVSPKGAISITGFADCESRLLKA